MKNYILGMITMFSIAAFLFMVVKPMFAAEPIPTVLDNPNAYFWQKTDVLPELELDTPVIDYYTASIFTGYSDEGQTRPIMKYGTVIIFKSIPSLADLEKIDLALSANGLYRENGVNISDKLIEIENTVKSLK